MSKIVLELNSQQVQDLVEKLPIAEKLRLVRRLGKEIKVDKFDDIVQRMRRTVRKAKISNTAIDHLCEEVKREYDEKYRRN